MYCLKYLFYQKTMENIVFINNCEFEKKREFQKMLKFTINLMF